MTRRRSTIAGRMMLVLVVAVLLAVFRLGSFRGLISLIPFGIAALVARFGSSPWRFRTVLGIGAVGTLILPFLVAIGINHAIWGYYLGRPGLDRRIVEAGRVETLTHLDTTSDRRGNATIFGRPVEDVEPYIQPHPQEGDYYVLEGRILRTLKARGVLPPEAPPDLRAGPLGSVYRALDETGRLEDGEPGYRDARNLRGILVEAVGQDGRRLLFAGVRGGEVANDHYPYYEFLFAIDPAGGRPKLLSFQRFYFDVAGMEGAEWPVIFPVLAFLGLLPTVVVQVFVLWHGGRARARRQAADAAGEAAGGGAHSPSAV